MDDGSDQLQAGRVAMMDCISVFIMLSKKSITIGTPYTICLGIKYQTMPAMNAKYTAPPIRCRISRNELFCDMPAVRSNVAPPCCMLLFSCATKCPWESLPKYMAGTWSGPPVLLACVFKAVPKSDTAWNGPQLMNVDQVEEN